MNGRLPLLPPNTKTGPHCCEGPLFSSWSVLSRPSTTGGPPVVPVVVAAVVTAALMLAAVSVVASMSIVAISWERREHFGNSHSGIPSLLGGDGHSPTSPARLIAAPVGEFLGGLHSQAISRKGRRIPRQLPGRAGAVALRLCRRSARWCTRWTLTTRTRSTGAGRTPPQACVRTISRALGSQHWVHAARL